MEEIRKQIIESNEKFIELKGDTFIWHITNESDNELLTKIKSAIINNKKKTFNSPIFELLHHKWYISICTNDNYHYRGPRRVRNNEDSRHTVQFILHCVSKASIDCRITYHLLQTKNKTEHYEAFDGHWRRGGWRPPHETGRAMLSQKATPIKTLNELTLKIDIAIISEDKRQIITETETETNEDEIDKEVMIWLTDIVKLPQYLDTFKKEAIESMEIVKLLEIADLNKMGIIKVGHVLKIIHYIDMLQQKQNQTK